MSNTGKSAAMNKSIEFKDYKDGKDQGSPVRQARLSLKHNESVTSIGSNSKRPIQHALFIQNLNPLKQQLKRQLLEKEDDDLIEGGGAQVEIQKDYEQTDQGTNNEPGSNSLGGQHSSVNSTARQKLAAKLAEKNALPKADTIQIERQNSLERKKIHPVKYMPKSDEEILDVLIQANSLNHTSNRKLQKDAKAQLAQKKEVIAQRDDKLANASEVSDVETVVPSNALFSVDVNLENLKDHLAQIRDMLAVQNATLIDHDTRINHRASEKLVGKYLERIAFAIPKTLGERPHAFKLDDPAFFDEEFETEYGHLLKEGVEKVIEKMEIMSAVLNRQKKFKEKAEQRIKVLEDAQVNNVQRIEFNTDMEKSEARIFTFIRANLEKFQLNLNSHKEQLDESVTKFDKQITDYRSQVLWRIKDCEELLKSRVSTQELNDQVKAVETRLKAKSHLENENIYDRMQKSYDSSVTRIKTCEVYVSDKFNDIKQFLKNLDEKHVFMATREDIKKIQEQEKQNKVNSQLEFERFQQYLKDQNTRFSKQDTRQREIEKTLKKFNEVGGIEELVRFMQESKEEKDNPYFPRMSGQNLNATMNIQNNHEKTQAFNSTTSTPGAQAHGSNMNMPQQLGGSGLDNRQTKFMQDMLQDHESRIEQLLDIIDEKLDKSSVENLISDKVGKSEIAELLPNMQAYENKMQSMIEESQEDIWTKIEEKLIIYDQRMISIRNEFDIVALNRFIAQKANKESVQSNFQNHEFKISTLDKNIVAIAQDFETFQTAINKMHSVVIELQEVNKDVIVGKRNLNCLSCGIKDGQSAGGAASNINGKDGRIYRGLPAFQHDMMQESFSMTQATTQSRVGSANPRGNRFSEIQGNVKEMQENGSGHFRTVGGAGQVQPTPYGISAEVRMRAGQGGSRMSHKQNNLTMSNQFDTKSMPGLSHNQSDVRFNTSHQRKKLPIGFLVQQEKRELHKMGMQMGSKMRPDSAKVTLGNRSRGALLGNDV